MDEGGRDIGTKRNARDIPSERVVECESPEKSRSACPDMICALTIFSTHSTFCDCNFGWSSDGDAMGGIGVVL